MANKDITVTANSGIGVSTVLFLIFLVLKLCNVITWSWWWVTAPLWIPFVLFFTACIIVFLVGFCIGVIRSIVKIMKGRK